MHPSTKKSLFLCTHPIHTTYLINLDMRPVRIKENMAFRFLQKFVMVLKRVERELPHNSHRTIVYNNFNIENIYLQTNAINHMRAENSYNHFPFT